MITRLSLNREGGVGVNGGCVCVCVHYALAEEITVSLLNHSSVWLAVVWTEAWGITGQSA